MKSMAQIVEALSRLVSQSIETGLGNPIGGGGVIVEPTNRIERFPIERGPFGKDTAE
jgi:hypothetical protein